MAFEDMETEGEGFLEEEKRNDPSKIQKEAIELQRESLAFMKEQIAAENKRRIGPPGEVYGHLSVPQPKEILFGVRRIGNGWILAKQKKSHLHIGEYGNTADETYFDTIDKLVAAAGNEVRLFAAAYKPEAEVPDGT